MSKSSKLKTHYTDELQKLMQDYEMFEPFERLIEINLCGQKVKVPENNTILRCLQFLEMETISEADLCWNGECLNCQVKVLTGEKERSLIACRADAIEGMKIVSVSDDLKSFFNS